MRVPLADWERYIKRLSATNEKAAELMQTWIGKNGYEKIDEMIAYANGLTKKYGEAAAALACQMYDAIAAASAAAVPAAVPAEIYAQDYIANAVRSELISAPSRVPSLVGRMVRQAGADTMLQNAKRDGAEFAWVPHGDTCAFCITIASNGWQKVSKRSLNGGHAEHIHANCDCTYAVRFDGRSTIDGYDPQDYKQKYDKADGFTPKDRINSMRREIRKANKDEINAQERLNYDRNKNIVSARANKNLLTMKESSIVKSIRSWQNNIEEHKAKIADPEKYDAEWNEKSDVEKAGLLEHWKREINANETNILYAENELQRREKSK